MIIQRLQVVIVVENPEHVFGFEKLEETFCGKKETSK